jgi:GNAT superfamily N-acetyltransferase
MSLYADYVKEREGNECLEYDWGFIEYAIRPPFLCIESMYIKPEVRGSGKTQELVEGVTRIAKERGIKELWARVSLPTAGSNLALKIGLHMGGVVQVAENGCIILTKRIED